VDAGAGLPGTVHSEEEDAGSRDRKGSSGLNMNVQEGGQEEEEKAESRVADAEKDPRRVTMFHVISNWIKKPEAERVHAWGKGCQRRSADDAMHFRHCCGCNWWDSRGSLCQIRCPWRDK
jgi:hypothetical protein